MLRGRVGLLVTLAVLAAAWGLVVLALIGGPVISCGTGCPEFGPQRAERDAVSFEFFIESLPGVMPLYAAGLVLVVAAVVLVRRALARRRSR